MRGLLDTNVIVSAVLFGGTPRELLRAATRGDLLLVTSPALLDELEELLQEKFGFTRAAAMETRRELESVAEVVEPAELPGVCRAPDDDQVLAAGSAGDADAIVTGDDAPLWWEVAKAWRSSARSISLPGSVRGQPELAGCGLLVSGTPPPAFTPFGACSRCPGEATIALEGEGGDARECLEAGKWTKMRVAAVRRYR